MIRLAAFLAVAVLIFGIGGVLGVGELALNRLDDEVDRATTTACERPEGVVEISFSKTKYAHIRAHYRRSVREGWPSTFVLNRKGADERRDKLLEGVPTKPGFDRDESPPAVGRKTWRAHVALVPSGENRSHGASLGVKLRRYCDQTRFRYAWY